MLSTTTAETTAITAAGDAHERLLKAAYKVCGALGALEFYSQDVELFELETREARDQTRQRLGLLMEECEKLDEWLWTYSQMLEQAYPADNAEERAAAERREAEFTAQIAAMRAAA
jgi:hypothetical protein